MGMKLKSGADLCGFQLTNFCIQSDASAPSDAGIGRKYFHTNATDDVATGISLLNRERIYLGEGAWRATAYLDDIAAINEKLNLITGDTDTDTLINTLKDLEEFLKDFSETDKLKSLLDGKLDKSGGTITISTYRGMVLKHSATSSYPLLWFANGSGNIGAIGIDTNKNVVFENGTTVYDLIHSGNIGSYAIKVNPVNINLETDTNVAGYGQTTEGWPIAGPALLLGNSVGNFAMMLSGRNGVLRFNTRENGALTGWKTIAFTDSNVAWSQGLKHSNGTIGAVVNSSGNVLIGTANEIKSGAKLQVKGDLYVDGNIIATKEVSAGGAGAEEGTSGSGSAEGVSEIFTPTSTSKAFDHNLGEDVIVQVYEKSGNVWNMVIVDTEITSATRVTLRFGKTETTQHKVVIMGV